MGGGGGEGGHEGGGTGGGGDGGDSGGGEGAGGEGGGGDGPKISSWPWPLRVMPAAHGTMTAPRSFVIGSDGRVKEPSAVRSVV